jgi:hypothetical protein
VGESDPQAWAILTRFLGEPPRYERRDDQIILHLGDRYLAATNNAFWSDPNVFGDESMLHVSWAGQHLTLRRCNGKKQLMSGQALRRRGVDKRTKLMRLPVRYIRGRWVLDFGGDFPIPHGAEGELLIEARLVEDCIQKRLFMRREYFPVFQQGTVLLAIVDIRDWSAITEAQRAVLIPRRLVEGYPLGSPPVLPSQGLFAVPVTLSGPTTTQLNMFPDDGTGLWLMTEGVSSVGLASTTVVLPNCIATKPANSLNHALTILSETYETWRQSHTGSVYRQFLYQEEDRQWHPLSLIRDNQLASASQRIARELWLQLAGRLSVS